MVATSIDPARYVPAALREDLDLHPGPLSLTGALTWTLHDPVRNCFFSIGELEFGMLQRWGPHTVNELVALVNEQTPLGVTAQHVMSLEHFLTANQLVQISGEAALKRLGLIAQHMRVGIGAWLLHRYLFFRVPLLRPDAFLSRTLPAVSFVFSRNFALLIVLAGMLGIYLVTRQWDAFTGTFSYFFSLDGILIYALALLISKMLHELGHAYTAKRYGLKVPTMGVAFLVMWPVLFTDTTDAWKLTSRKQRMAISAAGVITELALAASATLAWSFLPEGAWKSAAFFLATASWTITVLINANPFMRWDGYYLLSDYLGVQNLQDRAFALARWKLREWLFGLSHPAPEQLPAGIRWKMLLYAYLTWVYRLVLFLGIALLVYHFFFKAAGLFLMAVEVIWFIARPFYREFTMWYKLRDSFSWNRHSFTSLLMLGGLLFVLTTPWKSRIDAPALLSSATRGDIYPPWPAQIDQVLVRQGQHVRAGDTLFILKSPDLDQQLHLAKQRIETLRPQLSRQISNKEQREQRLVLEQQLAESIAKYRGLTEQRQRLVIHAPFSAEVESITEALTVGRWVHTSQRLATLVLKGKLEVNAYVREDALGKIRLDSRAQFYPDSLDEPARELKVVEIDPAGISTLDEPYLASIYSGPIAVHQQQEQLIPNESYYRVRLLPEGESPPVRQVSRGIVKIEGQPHSLLQQAWLTVGAVVIRESGF